MGHLFFACEESKSGFGGAGGIMCPAYAGLSEKRSNFMKCATKGVVPQNAFGPKSSDQYFFC